MKRLFVLSMIFLGFLFNSSYADVAFVENYFNKFIAMEADFKQTVVQQNKKDVSTGVLKIRKKTNLFLEPGFYFDYVKPFPQKIVSNGDKLWHYDMDLDQVVIKKLATFEQDSPLFLLFNENLIQNEFNIRELSRNKYRLTPKAQLAANADLEYMDISFSKEQLSSIVAQQLSGITFELELTNIEPNAVFVDNPFILNIPKGVDVIDETK